MNGCCDVRASSKTLFTTLQKATNITPIEVIDMKDYGLMNGANVLKKALEIVNNK